MTNTLNTPAEALEYAYPLRVTRYELRRGSGGRGQHTGGDGIYREVELLADATVTILSERRALRLTRWRAGNRVQLARTRVSPLMILNPNNCLARPRFAPRQVTASA